MCLAVPMQLVEIDGARGVTEHEGVRYEVNLSMLDAPAIGDFVLAHAGFAIEKMDRQEAEIRLELFREMADAPITELGSGSRFGREGSEGE